MASDQPVTSAALTAVTFG